MSLLKLSERRSVTISPIFSAKNLRFSTLTYPLFCMVEMIEA